MDYANEIMAGAIISIFIVLIVSEKLWPRNKFPPVQGWMIIGTAFVGAMLLINAIVNWLIPPDKIDNLVLINGTSWGVLGGATFGILTISFIDYWYHRASHHFNWLWRASHQLHHSPKRVDVIGFTYTHPVEITIFALENIFVLQVLFRLEPAAVAITSVFVAFCGMFQHWNVRTPRWLGYFIQRPESHCYHHELNVHGSNYSNLPVWDILFGTFRNPESFNGRVGFEDSPNNSFWKILFWGDANRDEKTNER
jgi:sterol desaturase/sphingolipid hydroxylase (fatty acid hydroxylase superfamily)